MPKDFKAGQNSFDKYNLMETGLSKWEVFGREWMQWSHSIMDQIADIVMVNSDAITHF